METLLGIQILAILFAFFMLYITFLHFKRNNIKGFEFLFWVLLWSSFILFTLRPNILNPILSQLFIVRAMDFLMIIAFMILAYLGFQNHVGIKSAQRNMESLIRKLAIKNAQKNR